MPLLLLFAVSVNGSQIHQLLKPVTWKLNLIPFMYPISSSSVNPVTFIVGIQIFFIIDSTTVIMHTSIISRLQYCSCFKLAHLSPFLLLYNLYSIHTQRDLLKTYVSLPCTERASDFPFHL